MILLLFIDWLSMHITLIIDKLLSQLGTGIPLFYMLDSRMIYHPGYCIFRNDSFHFIFVFKFTIFKEFFYIIIIWSRIYTIFQMVIFKCDNSHLQYFWISFSSGLTILQIEWIYCRLFCYDQYSGFSMENKKRPGIDIWCQFSF